jgi:hypothetical protein
MSVSKLAKPPHRLFRHTGGGVQVALLARGSTTAFANCALLAHTRRYSSMTGLAQLAHLAAIHRVTLPRVVRHQSLLVVSLLPPTSANMLQVVPSCQLDCQHLQCLSIYCLVQHEQTSMA